MSILPQTFIIELYKLFKMTDAVFLTCNDLPFDWNTPPTTVDIYRKLTMYEHAEWSNSANPNHTYFLLLHDVDGGARETVSLCALEKSMGIRSTVSTFAKWIEPAKLYAPEEYFSSLVAYQNEGFCITYHCNVALQNGFTPEKAYDMFDADVNFLKEKGLSIQFYAAHGGDKNAFGLRNNDIYYPSTSKNKLISTHNIYGIKAFSHYSDGGLLSDARKDNSDIRQYIIEKVIPGGRHQILIHPQYYSAADDKRAQQYFNTHLWIKEYWDSYKQDDTASYWKRAIHALASRMK